MPQTDTTSQAVVGLSMADAADRHADAVIQSGRAPPTHASQTDTDAGRIRDVYVGNDRSVGFSYGGGGGVVALDVVTRHPCRDSLLYG
eukprot:COSAG05_NODE_1518_length_4652_cov_4.416209_1_plen_87_part_10